MTAPCKITAVFYLQMLSSVLFMASASAAQLNVSVLTRDNRPLADAIIHITATSAGSKLPAPVRQVEIDQQDKMFVPAVSVIQTGTSVFFPNSDNIRHQVYSFSPAKTFNLKLYSGRPAEPVLFDKSGVVVMGCNIHDQMVAWVVVVDSAWFGKTDALGKAIIKNIPDGSYALHAWHPGQSADFIPQALMLSGEVSKTVTLDATPIAAGMHHAGMEH